MLCCLQTLCVVVVRQHTQRRRSPRQQQQQLPVQDRAPGPLAQHPRARHPPEECQQLVPQQQGHLRPQCLGSLSGLSSTTGQDTRSCHAGLLTTDRGQSISHHTCAIVGLRLAAWIHALNTFLIPTPAIRAARLWQGRVQWQRRQCHVGAMRGCCVGLAVLCGTCLAAKPRASCCWCKAWMVFCVCFVDKLLGTGVCVTTCHGTGVVLGRDWMVTGPCQHAAPKVSKKAAEHAPPRSLGGRRSAARSAAVLPVDTRLQPSRDQ